MALQRKHGAHAAPFWVLTLFAETLNGGRSIAPSSNGKTTDSDSVNQGSNPWGASIFPDIY